jgi:hypothetical protein
MSKFGDLLTVALRIAGDGISPANSSKLLNLLSDPKQNKMLKIELCAYVEGLQDLRDLCYFLEGDGTDMPFVVASKVKALGEKYQHGNLHLSNTTQTLIREAIDWAVTEGGYTAPDPSCVRPPPLTVAQINQSVQELVREDRPRRRAAIESVRNAALAASGETEAARNRREQRMLREQEKEAEEAARIIALEAQAAEAPPLTMDEWTAHITSGLAPAIHYFSSRLFDSDGDRFKTMELFDGASLMDPHIAKTKSREEAFEMLEKLRHYPILDMPGEDNIVDSLKASWAAYRDAATRVITKKDYNDDNSAILTWHYRQSILRPKAKKEDMDAGKCRFCNSTSGRCKCHKQLDCWWKAAKLLALVMPSSGAAERVFSLLNNLFNDQQTRTFADVIYLALYLAYNKRSM